MLRFQSVNMNIDGLEAIFKRLAAGKQRKVTKCFGGASPDCDGSAPKTVNGARCKAISVTGMCLVARVFLSIAD